ncbi:D-amino-acid oxidase [Fusarium albosuccineum]|uniref:D-amino-acid oxidase n=1 Tax=Fusarium albosuccineum TaxID=1237068 RepID=A0A8H4L194_9HYPO|nr:D-amino-acid oxidase [Fusarium albosuccineum]
MSSHDSIVIVGAGVIGLDVALVLAERGYGQSITVVAEHLPGDTAPSYTSPWAGCNFSAISGTDANALRWDKLGYIHLTKLASEKPQETYVRRTASTEMWDDNVPHDRIKAMSEYLEDFRPLPADQFPEGVKFAASFTTLTVNAPKHLLYLYERLKGDYGVRFVRQKLPNLQAAFSSHSTQIVFNCIGNAAKSFPGVEDSKCYPTRGQVLLTLAPGVVTNTMRHGKDYETYVIPRPYSDGHVILGGYMQKGNGDGATYSYETDSILDRTKELSAEVRESNPEVIAALSGLRPSREGGARVEREDLTIAGQKRTVIHNYGAGGTGFQAGYGMAVDAVNTAEPFLLEIRSKLRSKL